MQDEVTYDLVLHILKYILVVCLMKEGEEHCNKQMLMFPFICYYHCYNYNKLWAFEKIINFARGFV
jgi:hypothetical protein